MYPNLNLSAAISSAEFYSRTICDNTYLLPPTIMFQEKVTLRNVTFSCQVLQVFVIF